MINIILLAAQDSVEANSQLPVFLRETGSTSILELIQRSIGAIQDSVVHLCYREQDISKYRLDKVSPLVFGSCVIIPIPGETLGSACTALYGLSTANPNAELLIIGANEVLDEDIAKSLDHIKATDADGAVLCFDSSNPLYSYVTLDDAQNLREAAYRSPISRKAITGHIWLRSTERFVSAAKRAIMKDAHIEGRYYIAAVLNELILEGATVKALFIDKAKYHPLRTEEQIRHFVGGI